MAWYTIEQISKILESDRPQFLNISISAEEYYFDRDNYEDIDTPSSSLTALINGDKGWLMYLRYEGDAGFSTRNPNYTGSIDEVEEYYLENGQRDEYPKSWTISISEILKAFEFFINEMQPYPYLLWHNDSGDGEAIGKAISEI